MAGEQQQTEDKLYWPGPGGRKDSGLDCGEGSYPHTADTYERKLNGSNNCSESFQSFQFGPNLGKLYWNDKIPGVEQEQNQAKHFADSTAVRRSRMKGFQNFNDEEKLYWTDCVQRYTEAGRGRSEAGYPAPAIRPQFQVSATDILNSSA